MIHVRTGRTGPLPLTQDPLPEITEEASSKGMINYADGAEPNPCVDLHAESRKEQGKQEHYMSFPSMEKAAHPDNVMREISAPVWSS